LLGVPNGFNNLGNQLTLHAGTPVSAAGGASGLYRTAQYLGAAVSTVVVAHVLTAGHASTATTGAARGGDGGVGALGACVAGLGGVLLLGHAATALRRRTSSTSTSVSADPAPRTSQETA
jgi:hypothetical protein